MTEQVLVDPAGRPLQRQAASTACPRCKAGKEKRENAAGFGPPVIVCGVCGYEFEGATEC